MSKLTNKQRTIIINNLYEPYDELLKLQKNKLIELIYKENQDAIPEDFKQCMEKYPNMIKSVNSVKIDSPEISYYTIASYEHTINKNLNFYYVFINRPCCNIYTADLKDCVKEGSASYKLIIKETAKYLDKSSEYSKIKSSIRCVLDNITNTTQLKNEFPEAYEALEKGDNSISKCDSIEKVRAKLKSKK